MLVHRLLAAAVATAFMVTGAAAAPGDITVLQGGRIIDGKGGAPVENGALVIKDGRVDAVLDATAPLPAGATVVDVRGKTLMPALIAGHAHLGLTEGDQAGASHVTTPNVLHQLQKYQRYGIGTVVSFGTDHDFIYQLRAQRKAGQIATPTILTAGHGFGVLDGAPAVEAGMDEVYRPTTVAQVAHDMDALAQQHPDLVKVWVDDVGKTVRKMDPQIYLAVVKEAHRHGLKVAAHVYYLADATRLAQDGVDIFGHSVRDKPLDPAILALMKQKDIAYLPTLALDDSAFVYGDKPAWMQSAFFQDALDPGMAAWLAGPEYKPKESERKDLAVAKANALAALKAGVRVGLGTDSGAMRERIQGFEEHRELELLVDAGFTPMQALQAGTGVNASIFGIASQRGTLAPGQAADILVLDANPLTDIRNTRKIHAVWLDGVQRDLTK